MELDKGVNFHAVQRAGSVATLFGEIGDEIMQTLRLNVRKRAERHSGAAPLYRRQNIAASRGPVQDGYNFS